MNVYISLLAFLKNNFSIYTYIYFINLSFENNVFLPTAIYSSFPKYLFCISTAEIQRATVQNWSFNCTVSTVLILLHSLDLGQ